MWNHFFFCNMVPSNNKCLHIFLHSQNGKQTFYKLYPSIETPWRMTVITKELHLRTSPYILACSLLSWNVTKECSIFIFKDSLHARNTGGTKLEVLNNESAMMMSCGTQLKKYEFLSWFLNRLDYVRGWWSFIWNRYLQMIFLAMLKRCFKRIRMNSLFQPYFSFRCSCEMNPEINTYWTAWIKWSSLWLLYSEDFVVYQ